MIVWTCKVLSVYQKEELSRFIPLHLLLSLEQEIYGLTLGSLSRHVICGRLEL